MTLETTFISLKGKPLLPLASFNKEEDFLGEEKGEISLSSHKNQGFPNLKSGC